MNNEMKFYEETGFNPEHILWSKNAGRYADWLEERLKNDADSMSMQLKSIKLAVSMKDWGALEELIK